MSTIESLDRLRSEFVRLAEADDHATGQPLERRTHLRAYAIVAAIGCALAAGAIVLSTHGEAGSSASGGSRAGAGQVHGSLAGRELGPPWSVRHPFPRGRRVSLESAQAALGRPITLPHDPLTNPSGMGPISLVTGDRISGRRTDTSVAISYPKSRLAVEYETPVPYANPAANYRGYVEDDRQAPGLRRAAYVGSVGGRPALVIRFHADSPRSNPASVEFVLHGVSIAVIGFLPAPTLLRVADSIARGSR
jgi:hypothetical protein